MKKIALMICFFLLMSGCGTQKELNELALILALGVDVHDDSGYQVTLQIADPSEIISITGATSGTTSIPIVNYTGVGPTFIDALGDAAKQVSRSTFYTHVALIVIGQDLAERGIFPLLDILEREPEIRENIPIVIGNQASAFQVLNSLTMINKLPAFSIKGKLKMNEESFGNTMTVSIKEFLIKKDSEEGYPIVSGVKTPDYTEKTSQKVNLEQAAPKSSLVSGLAVFDQEGKFLYWLEEEQKRSVLFLENRIQQTFITVPCDDENSTTIKVTYAKVKKKASMTGDHIKLSVTIKAEAEIDGLGCENQKMKKKRTITDFEKELEGLIEQEILASIKESQNRQTDIYGFGETIYRQNPDQWKKLKDQWEELFSGADVDVHAEAEIKRTGNITNSN
ncbi:Ger(x)C family spore germination protein [Peribacillus frigoritolerans]|uniref:Ger(x)C family spore germination protein n=1 Tax=Peribacillus frigoritolerans TaxID=450367 RepID=UPI00105A1396|nr:Ger(x)C family spore germination protein [Peribacillus frigoritolerans]TDL80934.1 Ger(x)C family spore germination protein [Peribacillus frigoritolerans]